MIVDASALCAILFNEPEREAFSQAVSAADTAFISPLQVWEAAVSAHARRGEGAVAVERLIGRFRIAVADIGAREAALALDAWSRFGKGRHPASLNLGDCFAYALARSRNLPLLYKGNDFALTDVPSAL